MVKLIRSENSLTQIVSDDVSELNNEFEALFCMVREAC